MQVYFIVSLFLMISPHYSSHENYSWFDGVGERIDAKPKKISETTIDEQNLRRKNNIEHNNKVLKLSVKSAVNNNTWFKILSHLPAHDCAHVQLTCLKLATVIKSHDFWTQYWLNLPRHNFKSQKLIDGATSDDYKNLVQQHYLFVKIFLLDIQGKGYKVEDELRSRFPNLSYTTPAKFINNRVLRPADEYNPCHHDSKKSFEKACKIIEDYNFYKKPHITDKLSIKKLNKAYTILYKLLRQHDARAISYVLPKNGHYLNQCHSQNLKLFHHYVDDVILNGDKIENDAMRFKYEGLRSGIHGYEQDRLKANELIAENRKILMSKKYSLNITGFALRQVFATSNDISDHERKFKEVHDYVYGRNDVKKNLFEAQKLIKPYVKSGDYDAYKCYLYHILKYPYSHVEECLIAGCFLQQLMFEEDPWAIHHSLKNTLEFTRIDTSLVEKYVKRDNIMALLIKTLGLSYGLNGYDRDIKHAAELIRKHKIHPYKICKKLQVLRTSSTLDQQIFKSMIGHLSH